MAEYERRRFVAAPPDALFDYLSDVANLPVFIRDMKEAHPGPGQDEVAVTAVVKDREVEGVAHLEVDRAARSMRWSSEGPNDYEGHLTVHPAEGGSEVELSVSTVRAQASEVDEALDRSLSVIARVVASPTAPVAGAS